MQVAGLTPSSPGCKTVSGATVCTISVPNLQPCAGHTTCYRATIVTYGRYDASNNTIPPGSRALSALHGYPFAITVGKTNTLTFTLQGIPVSARIVPSGNSLLDGTMGSGFTLSRCATAQSVSVYGVDAGGDTIVGAGAPSVGLAASGYSIAIQTPAPNASPNSFLLNVEGFPSAYASYELTASAKPGAGSGASAVQTHATLTFGSESCGTVTEYAVPAANAGPAGVAVDAAGTVWFAENAANNIATLANGTFGSYAIPTTGSAPYDIALESDGAMWFTERTGGRLARIAADGSIIENALTDAHAAPQGFAVGSDGAFWLAGNAADAIDRVALDLGPTPQVRRRRAASAARFSYARTIREPNGLVRHEFLSPYAKNLRPQSNPGSPMTYGGGLVETAPHIYLIFWGFSGPNDLTNDPDGVATYLQNFVAALNGSLWAGTMTQYWQKAGGVTTSIGLPSGQPAGVWYDASYLPPQAQPGGIYTEGMVLAEAARAFTHFTPAADPNGNYVIVTPHGTQENDYKYGDWCAYHTWSGTSSTAVTLLPYLPDGGATCGVGDVNSPGTLDPISIVGGHEIAESITDPKPLTGWSDGSNTGEIGDKCAWRDLGNTAFGNVAFPTQPLWSDARSGCIQGYLASSYRVPTKAGAPSEEVLGPDGAVWFTEYAAAKVGRIAANGSITEFAVGAGPAGIASGPDGALWIAESTANKIGRLTTSGALTEFPTGGGTPYRIVTGKDGALHFTEYCGLVIGRMTTTGAMTRSQVPGAGGCPNGSAYPGSTVGIAVAPDGTIWFTEQGSNKIGHLQ